MRSTFHFSVFQFRVSISMCVSDTYPLNYMNNWSLDLNLQLHVACENALCGVKEEPRRIVCCVIDPVHVEA